MELVKEFYQILIKESKKIDIIPNGMRHIIYDPMFTRESTINDIKEDFFEEDFCIDAYGLVFQELDEATSYYGHEMYLCDTDDLHDDEASQGYNYFYIGSIVDEAPFILMMPCTFMNAGLPNIITIYGPKYQFRISDNSIMINVCETVHSIRNALLTEDEESRKEKVMDILLHSDRPSYK